MNPSNWTAACIALKLDRKVKWLLVGLALFVSACMPTPAPKPPTPPPTAVRAIAVIVTDGEQRLVNALVGLNDITPRDQHCPYTMPHCGATGADGVITFPQVSASIQNTQLTVSLPGCQPYLVTVTLTANLDQQIDVGGPLTTPNAVMAPGLDCGVDPSTYTLAQLARIRGAMWPEAVQCDPTLLVPFGPRPNTPTNIMATDFLANYTENDQDEILQCIKQQGWTHVVVGPIVDSDGYHGQYESHDWRGANFDRFLDTLQKIWDAKLIPVVFIHPDGWSLDQTKALTPLFTTPRAQKLMRIVVPHGWEPCKYECSSYTWAAFGKWARETWPNALVLLHTVTDVDAPVGTDSLGDDNGHPNAEGWARVAPYYHGWLVQNAAFECPTCVAPNGKTNHQNFRDQFNINVTGSLMQRFHNGYAGWPKFSAWGNRPLMIYAGEFRSYWTYWKNRPDAEGLQWGDDALTDGADGTLDGCTPLGCLK